MALSARVRAALPLACTLLWILGASGEPTPEQQLADAVTRGDPAAVTTLLESGTPLEARDSFGRTPLYLAARTGNTVIARLLLTKGATPDTRNSGGLTALHAAAANGQLEVAELLLANCADRGLRDIEGRTPLHLASSRGYRELTELLVRDGADLRVRARAGTTAERSAVRYGQTSVAEWLRTQELAAVAPVDAAPPVGAGQQPRGTAGTTALLQEKLRELGYDPGPPGKVTAKTRESIAAFQAKIGQVGKNTEVTRCLIDRLEAEARKLRRATSGEITRNPGQ